jgi:hypothetical protein
MAYGAVLIEAEAEAVIAAEELAAKVIGAELAAAVDASIIELETAAETY